MLEGENKRFVLNSIDPKAHFEKYQRDFVWLVDAGVALKTDIVTEPKFPLLKTARPSQFKLYQSDTGMLMARYPIGVAQAAYLDSKEPNLGGVYEKWWLNSWLPREGGCITTRPRNGARSISLSTARMERPCPSRLNRGRITMRTPRWAMCLKRPSMA